MRFRSSTGLGIRRYKFSGMVLILKNCSPSLETSTLGVSDSTDVKHSGLGSVHIFRRDLLSTYSVLIPPYSRENSGNRFSVLDRVRVGARLTVWWERMDKLLGVSGKSKVLLGTCENRGDHPGRPRGGHEHGSCTGWD